MGEKLEPKTIQDMRLVNVLLWPERLGALEIQFEIALEHGPRASPVERRLQNKNESLFMYLLQH